MVLQRVSIDYISLSMPVFLTYFAIGLQPQVSIWSTTKFYIAFLRNRVITSNLNNPLPIKYRTKVQRVSQRELNELRASMQRLFRFAVASNF